MRFGSGSKKEMGKMRAFQNWHEYCCINKQRPERKRAVK